MKTLDLSGMCKAATQVKQTKKAIQKSHIRERNFSKNSFLNL